MGAVSEFGQLVWFALGTLVFIILLVVDIVRAFKKGVFWVPGFALVLSALTIQIMTFIEAQSDEALLSQSTDSSRTLQDNQVGKKNLFMIHTSRIMICVLVALFLPGMVRARSEEKWNKFTAVGLSVILDILSELLTIYRRSARNSTSYSLHGISWALFLESDVLISISLLWLILLLICATGASKSIRTTATQSIPFILANPDLAHKEFILANPDLAHEEYLRAIGDQVLKSWIVARICSPESIITKSMLISSAALAVTVCIISSVAGWVVHLPHPIIAISASAESSLLNIIALLELVFILIAWAVIVWRSLNSVRYYRRFKEQKLKNICTSGWCKEYFLEDFWTRHILEELEEEERKKHIEAEAVEAQGNCLQTIPVMKWTNSLSVRCLLWLRFIVVFFSNVCRFLLEVAIYNRVFDKIVSLVCPDSSAEAKKYEPIFHNVYIVGEIPHTVCVMNLKSIRRAEQILNKDFVDDQRLIKFLNEKMSSPLDRAQKLPPLRLGKVRCLDPQTADHPVSQDDEMWERYFPYMREGSWSWKLTAVSLIKIILSISPASGKEALEAYKQACTLMDLVDEWHPDSDSLLRNAADKEILLNPTEKISDRAGRSMDIPELAKSIGKVVKEKCERIDKEEPRSSPVDWEKLAAAIALYNLCTTIVGRGAGDSTAVTLELERSLAYLIAGCINNVGNALVDKCRKWAQNSEEEQLVKAIHTAAKYSGVVKALVSNPNIKPLTQVSTDLV